MLFSGTEYTTAPAADEIEVSVIGPGFGEAICLHIGDGQWCVIDSCVTPDDTRPTPIRYLEDIGVNPNQVFAVVASHWDDDHIRGFAELVKTCSAATPILSKAFHKKDFLSYAAAFDQPLTSRARSGVREIRRTFQVLEEAARRRIIGATPNRRVYGPDDFNLSHGKDVQVWTLSPSDAEFDNFMMWLASEMPSVRETRRVSVARKRNDLSVVVLVTVGDCTMLLGGDLEEHGQNDRGWSAILSGTGRPTQKASLYKVSHHGSTTGDHPRVWSDLLESDPIAIVAPWKLGGRSLPSELDVKRILGNAPNSHATIALVKKENIKRSPTVDKTIRSSSKAFSSAPQIPGMLRLRRKIDAKKWTAEHFGGAVHLSKIHA